MSNFALLRQAWEGVAPAERAGAPQWPSAGLAIEGDFSGIQRFVLRPVPGAGGAARRLRARSFRVLALTRLVAHSIENAFADIGAHLYYSAGGRFLVVGRPCSGWQERLAAFQATLDQDLLTQHRGELAFHLAGAEFNDGRVPRAALADSMARRKLAPLAGALRSGAKWSTDRFFFLPDRAERCDGCAGTDRTRQDGDEKLCPSCIDDRDLGGKLLGRGIHSLVEASNGPLRILGKSWTTGEGGRLRIPSMSHVPMHNGQLATFEQLAAKARGRPYLAYLRIDADRIGAAFAELKDNAAQIWGLSRLLDSTFSSMVNELLLTRFQNVYPVYGGGDDLFVIGPWQEVLAFASSLRSEFRRISDGRLTFSAGVSLAKKKQHILTKSDEAEHALNAHAKAERDSIHALGATMRWPQYEKALKAGQELAELHAGRKLRSAVLKDILELHARWKAGDARWHSLLHYQAERNLKEAPEARDFVQRTFLRPGDVWPQADFAVRYAMLTKSQRGVE